MTPNEFREMRQQCGLLQRDLAKILGVRVNTVSRWEVGKLALPKYASAYIVERHRNLWSDRPAKGAVAERSE